MNPIKAIEYKLEITKLIRYYFDTLEGDGITIYYIKYVHPMSISIGNIQSQII